MFSFFFNLVEKNLSRVKKFSECCGNGIACLWNGKLRPRRSMEAADLNFRPYTGQTDSRHILKPLLHALKKSARHAKFLAPCRNHFGMALPIYRTQNKTFFTSWVRSQFLISTPSLHLFYSPKMADKQLAVIFHHISRVKCDLNRNRKSHHRLSKETDRHLGEMRKNDGRRNVTQCSVNNFKDLPFFSFECSTPAGLVFLLFIFLSQLFHFIHQILHCVTFKISIFHLNLTYIYKKQVRGIYF